MRLINISTQIDFMSQRRAAAFISATLIIISIISFFFQGLNRGIDFTGGVLIELDYQEDVLLDDVREILADSQFSDAVVQYFGSSRALLIRVMPRAGLDDVGIGTKILDLLRASTQQSVQMRRVEFVGPQVGDELTEDGGLAMIWALLGILIYVAMRFQMRFSFGAIVALIHDVIITIGFFSLTQINFDLSVLAAILAVIGYSLNDTIVVFDRIRENFQRMRKKQAIDVINTALNQTLNRTIMTSVTTLLVLLTLFFLGGEIIRGFSIALIIGVLIGTYSSLYIASPVILALGITSQHLIPEKKEDSPQPYSGG